MTFLFVSPHLDDAAWSCAGAMVERRERGERVVVCTVFAGDEARRREDKAALARIGARAMHIVLEDDGARQPPSFRSLVLEAEPSPTVVATVGRALRRVVGELEPETTFVPLGIGGHVDHRAVFLAARDLPGARFYEDRPYAFAPALVQLRRLELEGGCTDATPAVIDAQIGPAGCGALFEPEERDACIDALASRLRSHHAGLGLRLVDERAVHHDRHRTAVALDLVRAYSTQIAWLGVTDRIDRVWAPDGVLIERTYALQVGS